MQFRPKRECLRQYAPQYSQLYLFVKYLHNVCLSIRRRADKELHPPGQEKLHGMLETDTDVVIGRRSNQDLLKLVATDVRKFFKHLFMTEIIYAAYRFGNTK